MMERGAADESTNRPTYALAKAVPPPRLQHEWSRNLCPRHRDLVEVRGGSLNYSSVVETSMTDGVTLPAFQSGKDSVILALPLPASLGTRTEPQKRTLHSQCRTLARAMIGLAAGSFPGNSTSTAGKASGPARPRNE